MTYHAQGNFVSGCWISIQRGAIQLVWGEGISLHNRDLTREEVFAIHRLQHQVHEPSDWRSPKESGEAWHDLPPVPWVVAFMELVHLDTSKRYDCFNVNVPAHLVPARRERAAVGAIASQHG
jgi:hypothetical protein